MFMNIAMTVNKFGTGSQFTILKVVKISHDAITSFSLLFSIFVLGEDKQGLVMRLFSWSG